MKCPEQYRTVQHNIRKSILDEQEDRVIGEYHLLIENQSFCECYKEQCAAWDKEKKLCRKVGG